MRQIIQAFLISMIAAATLQAHATDYSCDSGDRIRIGTQGVINFTIRETSPNILLGTLYFSSLTSTGHSFPTEGPRYLAPIACTRTVDEHSSGIECAGLVLGESIGNRSEVRVVLTVSNDTNNRFIGKGIVSNEILDGIDTFAGPVICTEFKDGN